jgi:hypothetical protein
VGDQCVFVRDFSQRPPVTTSEVSGGCEWVLSGEGTPTRKWDGTAVLVRSGKLYARFDCKKGRTPPEGFSPCEPEPDPSTGHWPGWVEVTDQPQYKWHRKTFAQHPDLFDGTYELCGPKINGNPIEGLVFHHPDGRMAKIRRDDFGFAWPPA